MEVFIRWRRAGTPATSGELKAASPLRLRVGRAADCEIVLGDDDTISRYHATIDVGPGGLTCTDLGSGNGTFLAGDRVVSVPWQQGDVLSIGSFELQFSSADSASILLPAPAAVEQASPAFPGTIFDSPTVSAAAIKATGKLAAEVTYAAIGGGLGSFVWVDHLRVFGVPAGAIRVLGIAPDRKPYAKYARLCRNSQIPDHERVRSNSISAPDNVWGFPGYALRECWSELNKGNPGGLRYLWQVFAEPALAESYTPRAGHVFASLDAEATRIGWNSMWVDAQVLQIRKTDDDRYVVAYRVPRESAKGGPREQFMIARQLHIATGYPASNFLPDLQDFRASHPNAGMVVNAYEEHEAIYQALASNGGTVLIRGRGIVASRVIQRLSEVRAKNKGIRAIHLMRSPVTSGSRFGPGATCGPRERRASAVQLAESLLGRIAAQAHRKVFAGTAPRFLPRARRHDDRVPGRLAADYRRGAGIRLVRPGLRRCERHEFAGCEDRFPDRGEGRRRKGGRGRLRHRLHRPHRKARRHAAAEGPGRHLCTAAKQCQR